MKSSKITKFTNFIDDVDVWDLVANTVLFRGQSVKGNLLPSIARTNDKNDSQKNEKEMLKQMTLRGASFLRGNENDLELLVLAQHYGLKTRLLDWTSNPLAALWFACSQDIGDGYVYALQADNLLQADLYEKNPFSHGRTKAFQPRLNNSRIIAQDGWFTLHCYAKDAKKFVALEKNKFAASSLHEYIIDKGAKKDILRMIDKVGINQRTLFPDLEGLCRHLNWKYFK